MNKMKELTMESGIATGTKTEACLSSGEQIDTETKRLESSIPTRDNNDLTQTEQNADHEDSLDDDQISITLPVCWMTEDHI